MQHQLWLARQSVLRRLGSPEDACVVSSDAELDAKLELFRSISESSALLQRLTGEQRERSSALAHEEAALGGFLREASSLNSGDASRALAKAGKTIAYMGAQRGTQRTPLLRLQRELDTFRARGVSDTRTTVSSMENARQSYRASLSWMKAASAKLDPDTGAGLHQYRKAQAQVRQSKATFDKLTLDCLQKVDLLAAARCNMFSHALVNYQNSLLEFLTKASETLNLTAQTLSETPSYEFSILKELSQGPTGEEQNENVNPTDKDTMLFFQDEFKDIKELSSENKESVPNTQKAAASSSGDTLENAVGNLIDSLVSIQETNSEVASAVNPDLLGLNLNESQSIESFMPSQLLQDFTSIMLQNPTQPPTSPLSENASGSKNEAANSLSEGPPSKKLENTKKDRAMWFKLFAELDPLANPDAMPGINANQSHAA